ncbi:FadR/GntR family transcriptional regulator [Microbacterium sp. NPDC056234]|uniref:FadR/GntR family transcriptional regulator n=1 Tax=Microbacterium sp. NPDC056234 TaxID=3345757 RepID=UPI0035E2CB57
MVRQPRRVAGKLSEPVIRDIADSIVTGEIEPGQALPPESVICEEFGVSRTVVRESLQRLAEKGLLSAQQGRGTIVTERSQWNLLDPVVLAAMVAHDDSLGILDEVALIRASLESEMAAAVAASASTVVVEELRARLDAQHAAVKKRQKFRDADLAFHQAIIDASGNRLGRAIARRLVGEALTSDRFHGDVDDTVVVATLDEHEAILEAIAARDPERARELMKSHVDIAWQRRRRPRASA